MKNLIFKFILVITGAVALSSASAQDIHFSQFHETPLYRNPALAGIVNGDVRIQTVYRTQWNSIANAYKTGSLNAEYKMPVGTTDDYLTVGGQFFYDKAGTSNLTTTHMLPAINYHKSISSTSNAYLSVGFMGGLVNRRFDRSKITTNSQYEGLGDGETSAQSEYSYLDGSVGMSLNMGFGENVDNNMYLGAAFHHFNKPKNSFYNDETIRLSSKYTFSGGLKFGVTEASYLTIEGDHIRQGTFQETVAGMMYGIKIGPDLELPDYTLHAGAYLRVNDAFIPTVKLDYRPFSIGLSYDVNISKLKASSYGRGGFELSLSYVGFTKRDNSSLNAVRCPRY